jgi:hypothetical protein
VTVKFLSLRAPIIDPVLMMLDQVPLPDTVEVNLPNFDRISRQGASKSMMKIPM